MRNLIVFFVIFNLSFVALDGSVTHLVSVDKDGLRFTAIVIKQSTLRIIDGGTRGSGVSEGAGLGDNMYHIRICVENVGNRDICIAAGPKDLVQADGFTGIVSQFIGVDRDDQGLTYKPIESDLRSVVLKPTNKAILAEVSVDLNSRKNKIIYTYNVSDYISKYYDIWVGNIAMDIMVE